MKKRKNRGITLIALVITIIVLLILAAITLNLIIGERGIFKMAEEAGRNYTNAANYEEGMLGSLLGEADDIVAGERYTMVEGVPVPRGFTHTEGTIDTGFVIEDTSGNSETNGNEYVWIPCTIDGKDGSIKYDRYAFSKDGWEFSQQKDESTGEIIYEIEAGTQMVFFENMPEIERQSVSKYGGFYMGRYQVGVEGGSLDTSELIDGIFGKAVTDENWTGWKNGKAVVQKDKQIWDYLTYKKAKEIAESMYHSNRAVISRLCSSYAYDTTLKYIQKNQNDWIYYDGDTLKEEILETTGQGILMNNIYIDSVNYTSEFWSFSCIETPEGATPEEALEMFEKFQMKSIRRRGVRNMCSLPMESEENIEYTIIDRSRIFTNIVYSPIKRRII